MLNSRICMDWSWLRFIYSWNTYF